MTRAATSTFESNWLRAASGLASLAVILHLTVSANLLRVAGIDYAHDGGSPISKFHPATFLIFAALACLAASADRLRRVCRQAPGLSLFPLALAAIMLLSAASVGVSGDTVYVESYLSAALLAIVCRALPGAAAGRVARLAVGLIALNVAIALGESATSTHLVPIFLEDRTLADPPTEFRPAALFDHPLTAAAATLVGLLVLPDLGLGRVWTRLAGLFLMTGLVAFGERTPLALGLVFMGLRTARETASRLLRRRITGAELGLASLPIIAMGTTAAAVAAFGADRGDAMWPASGGAFGGRLAAHLVLDASASARLDQWRVLGLLDLRGWLLGTPIADIPGLVYKIGLSRPLTGIESFWLFALLDLGLIGFAVWAAGLACFLREIWRGASRAGRGATLALLLAASCSNSLGRKCNLLVVLVACVAPAPPRHVRPRGQPA